MIQLIVLFVLALSQTAHSAKILILPGNVRSHILYFGRLGEELALHGHNVTLLIPSNNIQPPLQRKDLVEIMTYLTEKNISFVETKEVGEMFIEMALAESLLSKLKGMSWLRNTLIREANIDCTSRFRSKTYEEVKASKYDFAVVDPLEISCGFTYPYSLDIPYAALGLPIAIMAGYRVPALPSFVPAATTSFSDSMTFMQRLVNLLADFASMTILYQGSTEFSERYAPHKPPLSPIELYAKSTLLLNLQEPTFFYPTPTMPNTVSVGHIMARPASPLTGELKDFLDGAENGAMLVSLGSYFNFVPQDIVQRFCEAFSRLKIKVIWKMDTAATKSCDLDETRIKVISWIQQNDLLAHPNVKVFLTHGGLNSIIESIYHAKVMLVMPIALDQPFNANIVHIKKLGIALSLLKFQSSDVVQNIEKLLSEDIYKSKMQVASEILREKPLQPGEAASFWINHVIKYGDGHLRSRAFELNVFQFLMIDIFLFLVVTLVVIICVLYFACLQITRGLKGICKKEGKKKLN